MQDGTLSVGEVAERSGFAASAIRYYEREGLIGVQQRDVELKNAEALRDLATLRGADGDVLQVGVL